MLPLLWSLYPGHPNLLPAYYDDPHNVEKLILPANASWVSKPVFGREGFGVFQSSNFSTYDDFVETTESNFGFDG
jgi:glutathionylspermidine synthase